MENLRYCKNCKKKHVIFDSASGSWVCELCGFEQEVDNLQAQISFDDLGAQGTFINVGSTAPTSVTHINGHRIYLGGSHNYKESKLFEANKKIEEVAQKLGLSSARINEVKQMIEEVTEGEMGKGDWFLVLIGACCYAVMRKNHLPDAIANVAAVIESDVFELGRMVIRVKEFLNLEFPELDIIAFFERELRNCSCFSDVSKEKKETMLNQGRFICQCSMKWFLLTGRHPLPMIAAILAFVAEVNEINIGIIDIAKEINAVVSTSKLRYKELQNILINVAQVLPWGKNITVNSLAKNAPFLIKYMELKSNSKTTLAEKDNPRNSLKFKDFLVQHSVSGFLGDTFEYGQDNLGSPTDSQYFDIEERNGTLSPSHDDLMELKLSEECLSCIHSNFVNKISSMRSKTDISKRNKRKRKKVGISLASSEWWAKNLDSKKKPSIRQILQMNVGFDSLPPSFVMGINACKMRKEKINSAKMRIENVMYSKDGKKSNLSSEYLNAEGKKKQGDEKGNIDWEDCIIEILLLHGVKEEEIEQGHYNRLLELHVYHAIGSH